VTAVLPRATSRYKPSNPIFIEKFNAVAKDVNKSLHTLEEEFDWIKVMRQPDFVNNRRLLSNDGLHLSQAGARAFTTRVKKAIRETIQQPCPADQNQAVQTQAVQTQADQTQAVNRPGDNNQCTYD